MSLLHSIRDVLGFLVFAVIAVAKSIVQNFIPAKYKMKNIVGEIALVTGGGGGLGRLISLRLANIGAIVVVWDINKDGIEETVKLVQAAGGTCYGYVCDLCDREDVYRKAALLKEQVGQVSILINNAGVVSGTNFLDTPDKLIIRTMDVNVMSHFWTCKAFLPGMMERNKGHIVSIASMAGQVGIPKLADYCASKFAAIGFEQSLQMELENEGYNIQTTVVCPYFIRSTGMFEDVKSRVSITLRFVPTLSPNEVAERVITAMRCNERIALMPSYFNIMLSLRWLFPVSCSTMFLRGLVQDASPTRNKQPRTVIPKEEPAPILMKDQISANIHHQLTRRMSGPERKP